MDSEEDLFWLKKNIRLISSVFSLSYAISFLLFYKYFFPIILKSTKIIQGAELYISGHIYIYIYIRYFHIISAKLYKKNAKNTFLSKTETHYFYAKY